MLDYVLDFSVKNYQESLAREFKQLGIELIRFTPKEAPPRDVDLYWDPRLAGGTPPWHTLRQETIPVVATLYDAAPWGLRPWEYYPDMKSFRKGYVGMVKRFYAWHRSWTGLEWHAVFIVHLASGYFPTWSSFDDPDDYEEERRLLYVAMTRAKRELHLIKPEQIAGRGAFGGGFAETSPLIQDIPRFNQLAQSVTFSSRGTESLASPDRGRIAVNDQRLARIEDYFDES